MTTPDNDKGRVISWRKACDCQWSTSTTGRIISTTKWNGDTCIMASTLYPGPVCNQCDTPWEQLVTNET